MAEKNIPENENIEEGTLTKAIKDDPVFTFLNKHSNAIFYVVLIIAGGIFLKSYFYKSYVANQKQSADSLAKVISLKSDLETASDGEINKITKIFDDNLTMLKDSKGAYSDLGLLYKTLAFKDLSSSDLKDEYNKINLTKNSSIVEELRVLAILRKLLDQSENLSFVKPELKKIALESKYIHVMSALTLVKFSSNDQERDEALAILNKLKDKHPEQNSLIDPEIDRLTSLIGS